MQFNQFISWGFEGLIAGGLFWAVTIMSGMRKDLEILGRDVATVVERTLSHEKRIDRLEERV